MNFIKLVGRHIVGGFSVDSAKTRVGSLKAAIASYKRISSDQARAAYTYNDINTVSKAEYVRRYKRLRIVSSVVLFLSFLQLYYTVTVIRMLALALEPLESFLPRSRAIIPFNADAAPCIAC